jgi:hypothetical protein
MVIAWRNRHPIAVPPFAQQREQQPQNGREVVLDVRRDDARERRACLDPLHPVVEARQRDERLDAVVAEQRLQLVLGVHRIEGRDDGAELPRGELDDEELRAVGEQQRDAVAAPDAEGAQGRRARIAQTLELAVADGRPFVEQHGIGGPIARSLRKVVDERAIGVRSQARRDAGVIV